MPVSSLGTELALLIGMSACKHLDPIRNGGRHSEAVLALQDETKYVMRSLDLANVRGIPESRDPAITGGRGLSLRNCGRLGLGGPAHDRVEDG
jgi:hypothetical protein